MQEATMASSSDTALVIVDVQNDFLPPNGKLAVEGGRDILPHIRYLLDGTQDWPWAQVVASQDYHPQGHISFVTSHPGCENKTFQAIRVKTPDGEDIEQILWPEHCIQGTSGCELEQSIQEALQPWKNKGNYHLVQKGIAKQMDAYSAFASISTPSVKRSLEKSNSSSKAISNSPLAAYLKHHNINRLVITGIATDVCVKATAEDALACGFEIILVREAMKGVDEKNSDRALEDFSTQHGATVVNTVHDLKQLLSRSI